MTEFYGFIFFALYHIIVLIVLINMLIAMMARSFGQIEVRFIQVHVLALLDTVHSSVSSMYVVVFLQADADREWKYARTRLRMHYYTEVGSLPPPFNISGIGTVINCYVYRYSKNYRKRHGITSKERLKKYQVIYYVL